MSKILEQHVMALLRPKLKLSPNQHGFRKRYSTTGALVQMTQSIHSWLNTSKYRAVTGIFFDIKKAFDKVSHAKLLKSLELEHKLCPKLLRWLSSYLSGRSQLVTVGNDSSTRAPVTSGVPQGSVLAPALFVAFINSLLVKFNDRYQSKEDRNALLQAYADDLALLIPCESVGNIALIVQPLIDYITNEITNIGLQFNPAKTQACIFHFGNKLPQRPHLKISDEPIEITDVIKYLGIELSYDMHHDNHCQKVSRNARKMIGAFKSKFGKFASNVLKVVYHQCIRPQLDYGCVAWDPTSKKSIAILENAQKFATRSILNDWTITYENALSKLDLPVLSDHRQHLKLLQFYRYYNGHASYPTAKLKHSDMLNLRRSSRHNKPHHLENEKPRTETFKQSFEYSVIQLWNSLPYEAVSSSFDSYKTHVLKMRF
jgi:ribonucleases P/MRP protein subunit RPP40